MSKCVEKIPHEACGSSDALQVFQEANGKFTGYCFSCGTYVENPYGDKEPTRSVKVKSDAEIEEELKEIRSYSATHISERRLNRLTLDHFGVKVGYSRSDGHTPEVLYFPYTKSGGTIGYKARLLPHKKFWVVGSIRNCDFFGWEAAKVSGSKRLYVTEGEIDALTVWQVLTKKQRGTQWEDNVPAVVSLPSGVSAAKLFIASKAKELRSFSEVVFLFDNDEPGQKGVEAALNAYPTGKKVEYPGKDPNEALVKGHERALVNALLFKIEVPKNTRIVSLDDLVEDAIKPVPMGIPFPFKGLTELTRGLRMGETYYLGAGVKMGKTDLANTFITHFSVYHSIPVFIANLEQPNVQSTKKVLGKVDGKIFHDPKISYEEKDVREAAKKLKGRVYFLDAFQHTGWDSLKEDIYYAANHLKVKIVMVDPITNLTNGIDAGSANTKLQEIAQDMSMMARDLDIAIFIYCHLKEPQNAEKSHERGGEVFSSQFAGSRAMMRSCNYMLGLQGNKDPKLPIEQQNQRKLVMLEDREFGTSGIIPLYWDYRTNLFQEINE